MDKWNLIYSSVYNIFYTRTVQEVGRLGFVFCWLRRQIITRNRYGLIITALKLSTITIYYMHLV